MTYGTLTRQEESDKSGHIRTEGGIIGRYLAPPEVGGPFLFLGKSLSGFGVRHIITSHIIEVVPFMINDNVLEYTFKTETGSKYLLQINYN